jgi:hypothetical protein
VGRWRRKVRGHAGATWDHTASYFVSLRVAIIYFCQGLLLYIFVGDYNLLFVSVTIIFLSGTTCWFVDYFSFHLLLLTGAILKLSGKEMPHFEGPAAVYDDEFSAFEAVTEGRVVKGSVLVIRNEG